MTSRDGKGRWGERVGDESGGEHFRGGEGWGGAAPPLRPHVDPPLLRGDLAAGGVSGQYGGTGRGVSGQDGGTGRGVSGQYGGTGRGVSGQFVKGGWAGETSARSSTPTTPPATRACAEGAARPLYTEGAGNLGLAPGFEPGKREGKSGEKEKGKRKKEKGKRAKVMGKEARPRGRAPRAPRGGRAPSPPPGPSSPRPAAPEGEKGALNNGHSLGRSRESGGGGRGMR